MPKKLILGTSKWGDTVPVKDAMSLIEEWYYVYDKPSIDTATNYPINGGGADTSISYLCEYLSNNYTCELDITVKVGSVSRERIPDFDLSPDVVIRNCDSVLNRLQHHVKCLMVHWDTRSNYKDIVATLTVLKSYGIDVGISGVLHPEVYSRVLSDLDVKVDVQCKYSCLGTYFEKIPGQYYYSYKVSEGLENYNSGITKALSDPRLDGFLIGPKTVEQLNKTMCHVKSERQTNLPNDNALPTTLL